MTIQTYAPAQVQQYAHQQQQPQRRRVQGISALVYGFAKAGKSSLADSGPVPRLIVDIEGTSFWTPSRKVYWNPMTEPIPRPDGSWETCVVLTRDVDTIDAVYRILASGQHPFNSVSLDSVTEMQQRIIDAQVGWKKVERDQWGMLLRRVSWVTRQWRDLVTHPVRPIWTLTFVAGVHMDGRVGRWRPLVQGQVGDFLPYYVDVLGYLGAMPDQSRHLLVGPHPQYETGERVGGRLPYSLPIAYRTDQGSWPGYTMESMLSQVLAGR